MAYKMLVTLFSVLVGSQACLYLQTFPILVQVYNHVSFCFLCRIKCLQTSCTQTLPGLADGTKPRLSLCDVLPHSVISCAFLCLVLTDLTAELLALQWWRDKKRQRGRRWGRLSSFPDTAFQIKLSDNNMKTMFFSIFFFFFLLPPPKIKNRLYRSTACKQKGIIQILSMWSISVSTEAILGECFLVCNGYQKLGLRCEGQGKWKGGGWGRLSFVHALLKTTYSKIFCEAVIAQLKWTPCKDRKVLQSLLLFNPWDRIFFSRVWIAFFLGTVI